MFSDYLYSYETYKCVVIKDKTLGLIYWTLFFLIVFYIFGYIIVVDKGYLEYDTPVGIVRPKLIKPDSLVIRADDTHSYCAQSSCRIWDALDIVYPLSESDTLSITTAVTEIDQVRVCKETDTVCSTDVFEETGKSKFFVADVENFQLVVEHSMQAEKLIFEEDADEHTGFSESSRHMTGQLVATNNTVLAKFPRHRADRFPLRLLLEAADVDLDHKYAIKRRRNLTEVEETMRARGLVLFVVITYSNTNTFFGTHAVSYEYNVHRLHETNFMVYEALESEGDSRRHLHKRFGIHLKFILTGSIGRFSFKALLANIASALGLVTLSSIVVDQLALYVLPLRNTYFRYKYSEEATPKFNKYKQAKEQKKKEEEEAKKEKGGARVRKNSKTQ